MRWIERPADWFWTRVARSCRTAPGGLGVLRILSGLFLLIWTTPVVRWLGQAPPAFFNPPLLSPARLFGAFPSAAIATAADVVVVSLLVLVVLGVRARAATIALVGLVLAGNLFEYAFGKIDHDILLWAFMGCMAFSGWGRELAWVPDRPGRFDAPVRWHALLAVLLAFGMFSAGFEKALNWVDFDPSTSGFLAWFYPGYFDLGRQYLLAPYVLNVPPPAFELADYSAVAFELGCVVALLAGPAAWRAWLVTAAAFHLTNSLALNIPFDIHVLLLLSFVDFSALQRRLAPAARSATVRWGMAAVAGALALAHVVRADGAPRLLLTGLTPARQVEVELWLSSALWSLVIVVLVRHLIATRRLLRAPA